MVSLSSGGKNSNSSLLLYGVPVVEEAREVDRDKDGEAEGESEEEEEGVEGVERPSRSGTGAAGSVAERGSGSVLSIMVNSRKALGPDGGRVKW